MYDIGSTKILKAKDILSVAKELIDKGKRVRITVTGNSMYPFLRDSKDSVILTFADYTDIRFGDIVLVLQNDGVYVLHRVIKKKKRYFYTSGDAAGYREGPLYPEQVIAKVVRVWREDKEIKCANPLWRVLSLVWFLFLPFRDLIIKSYKLLSRIIKTVRSK
ncbi:MAG: putative transcriptional regulator [Anaerocolumna sp.]|jgi:signal peptidase I|nr:putative transcriptional regulator [Anaerocolumna sp.]